MCKYFLLCPMKDMMYLFASVYFIYIRHLLEIYTYKSESLLMDISLLCELWNFRVKLN
jgi:hypothetical protein